MKDYKELIEILEKRFEKNKHRHADIKFEEILDKLNDNILESISKMEETEGEPDVFVIDGEIYIVDGSKESPKLRRNLCYDKSARENRKKFPPESSAEEIAKSMEIEIVDENMYRSLQEIEDFDLKTSSWIKTENSVREKGGAIFGDKRYARTFIYHNGAESYYSSRGFRGYIKI